MKHYIIFLTCLFILIFVISGISASDLNDTDVSTANDDFINSNVSTIPKDNKTSYEESFPDIIPLGGRYYPNEPSSIAGITKKLIISPKIVKVGNKLIVDLYLKNTVGKNIRTLYVCPKIIPEHDDEFDYTPKLKFLGFKGKNFLQQLYGFDYVKTFKVNQTIHLRLICKSLVPGKYTFQFYMGVYDSEHVYVNEDFEITNKTAESNSKKKNNMSILEKHPAGNPIFLLMTSLGLIMIFRRF